MKKDSFTELEGLSSKCRNESVQFGAVVVCVCVCVVMFFTVLPRLYPYVDP